MDNGKKSGKIGYAQPPVEHRFSSDNQPEKRGRPAGSRNTKTILAELLAITENVRNPLTGEDAEVSIHEQILAKLVVMAKNGDLQSVDRVLDRLEGKPKQETENTNKNVNTDVTPLSKLSDDKLKRISDIIEEPD